MNVDWFIFYHVLCESGVSLFGNNVSWKENTTLPVTLLYTNPISRSLGCQSVVINNSTNNDPHVHFNTPECWISLIHTVTHWMHSLIMKNQISLAPSALAGDNTRVRPRTRFCVIFHIKILKNALKSRARVLKTHVEKKKKRRTIMDTRLRFQFVNMIKPLLHRICLYFRIMVL